MLKAAVLVTWLAVCWCERDMRQLYARTKMMYGGVSSSLSLAAEKEHYKSFVTFVKMVDNINHDASLPYNAEINYMSLETDAERHAHLGLNISKMSTMDREHISVDKRQVEMLEERAVPAEVDYSYKLPSVKNQGSCGSCWTFGAIAALEYQINRNRPGTPRALSEQQCLDCAYPSSRDGCNGGWPTACYDYANKVSKVAKMADYPYVSKDGKCKTNKKNGISGFTVKGGGKYITTGDAAMLIAVADKARGVLSVAISVINSMYSYKDGVYTPGKSSCNSVNHAVDVVGYGVLKGVAYWRVRNSWGGSWGDKGYLNMERGTKGRNLNTCRIASYAHYPEVSGQDDGTNGDEEEREPDVDPDEEEKEDGSWCKHVDRYLKGYAGGSKVVMVDLKTAKSACGSRSDCAGVTVEKNGDITLRRNRRPLKKAGFTSYVPGCEGEKDEDEKEQDEKDEDEKEKDEKEEDEKEEEKEEDEEDEKEEDEKEEDEKEEGEKEEEKNKVCDWHQMSNFAFTKTKSNVLSKLTQKFTDVWAECLKMKECGGVTCRGTHRCGMRKNAVGKKSKIYTSFKKVCK